MITIYEYVYAYIQKKSMNKHKVVLLLIRTEIQIFLDFPNGHMFHNHKIK